jgi:hypothetical protein
VLPAWDGGKTTLAASDSGFGFRAFRPLSETGTGRAPAGTTESFPTALQCLTDRWVAFRPRTRPRSPRWAARSWLTTSTPQACSRATHASHRRFRRRRASPSPPPLLCVSEALVETATRVRKGYGRNCLHHDLEVLNNPVPPPSTPSSPLHQATAERMYQLN